MVTSAPSAAPGPPVFVSHFIYEPFIIKLTIFIFCLSPSTIILSDRQYVNKGARQDMIGWKRVTRKEAEEALNAQKGFSAVEEEVCEGDIRLEIKPFESFRQVDKYTRYLSSVKNLKIISKSWSEEEGYNIQLSAQMPLALGRLLRDMPEVAQVRVNGKTGYKGYKKMVVTVKTTGSLPEPVPA